MYLQNQVQFPQNAWTLRFPTNTCVWRFCCRNIYDDFWPIWSYMTSCGLLQIFSTLQAYSLNDRFSTTPEHRTEVQVGSTLIGRLKKNHGIFLKNPRFGRIVSRFSKHLRSKFKGIKVLSWCWKQTWAESSTQEGFCRKFFVEGIAVSPIKKRASLRHRRPNTKTSRGASI